jgi:riboflavin kinase / FMN adenylyltransferase
MFLPRHLSELSQFNKPISLALGVFDGVHLGHQAVIRQAVHEAHLLAGDAAILTFHPHPAKILRPEKAPLLLTTEQQDFELFSALDLDICVILDFNEELSLCPAGDFLELLLTSAPTLKTLVVGPNWHFGRERGGDFKFLKRWAKKNGLRAVELKPVVWGSEVISSTVIRRLIAKGEIVAANQRLGRSYQLLGRVVRGEGLGTKIGFPTANLEIENELIPPKGVYAARILLEGEVFAAAVNIGTRPTVSHKNITTMEAHILEFVGDLYGHHLRVDFLAKIRDEQKFGTLNDLKMQIKEDTKLALHIAYA